MGHKILVVEDEDIYIYVYKRALKEEGYIIPENEDETERMIRETQNINGTIAIFAKDEDEAKILIGESEKYHSPFNAFVLDIILNNYEGGITLARMIKEKDKKSKSSTPIIFVTVLGNDPNIMDTIKQEHLTDFEILTKPFPPITLIKMLRLALNKQK